MTVSLLWTIMTVVSLYASAIQANRPTEQNERKICGKRQRKSTPIIDSECWQLTNAHNLNLLRIRRITLEIDEHNIPLLLTKITSKKALLMCSCAVWWNWILNKVIRIFSLLQCKQSIKLKERQGEKSNQTIDWYIVSFC